MITKDQWYDKLESWMPEWVFEDEDVQEAIFYGIAAMLERLTTACDEHFTETFICLSERPFTDEHGRERNVYFRTGETLNDFCDRIRYLLNTVSCPELITIAQGVVDPTQIKLIENPTGHVFFDSEDFYDTGEIYSDYEYNQFTILMNPQTTQVEGALVEALNTAKAFGVTYQIIVTDSPLPP